MLNPMKQPPRRVQLAQIAYLIVFGGFTVVSAYQLISGTATRFTWFFLGVGAFLFVATAYRMVRDLRKNDA
jgi:uncharacterized membrane protein YqgA involved in biofilm formation